MNAAQQSKLLELADFLYFKVRDEKFSLKVIHARRVGASANNPSGWAAIAIEELEDQEDCGTAGCALGWGNVLFGRDTFWNGTYIQEAQSFFGIAEEEAMDLFQPGHGGRRQEEETRVKVAERIRNLALTKEVTE